MVVFVGIEIDGEYLKLFDVDVDHDESDSNIKGIRPILHHLSSY